MKKSKSVKSSGKVKKLARAKGNRPESALKTVTGGTSRGRTAEASKSHPSRRTKFCNTFDHLADYENMLADFAFVLTSPHVFRWCVCDLRG